MKTGFDRYTKLGLLLLLTVALAAAGQPWLRGLAAHSQDEPQAWLDEFKRKEAYWDWEYLEGAGYRSLAKLTGIPSLLKIGVTIRATGSAYSDSSLHEKSPQYTAGILEVRLKASNHQEKSGTGQGTRGWGFWDGNLTTGNAAWFWSASSESDPQLQGLRTQVFRDGVLHHNRPLDIDMRAWHTYRVELTPERVVFKVDGEPVAESDRAPSTSQRVEIWLDNYKIDLTSTGYTKGYIDTLQNQYLLIDWVRYTPAANP